jgi:uncharacterized membrane protein YtjA (UPF0391 family)
LWSCWSGEAGRHADIGGGGGKVKWLNYSKVMLYYTLVFLLVALIAGALGFFAIAGIAAMIAKVLFFVFLILFIVSLLNRKRL